MNKLKNVMTERGITGAELSRACGINLPTVYNLMSGKEFPWPGYRRKISAYLNIPESELFDIEIR